MDSMLEQVRQFHRTFRVKDREYLGPVDDVTRILRINLIVEEFKELMHAMGVDVELYYETNKLTKPDLIEMADAICDLHYVISGTSLAFGIPEDACFAEVHRSNMSKADEDGTVHYRGDGKVLKSSRWSPPDLKSVIRTLQLIEHPDSQLNEALID